MSGIKRSKCCVRGCERDELIVHRFPIYFEDNFKTWLARISRPDLMDMDPKRVYNNYVVCHKHFADECKIPGSKKLKWFSLPTLHLPDFHELENQSFCIPSSSAPAVNISVSSVEESETSTLPSMIISDPEENISLEGLVNISYEPVPSTSGGSKWHESFMSEGDVSFQESRPVCSTPVDLSLKRPRQRLSGSESKSVCSTPLETAISSRKRQRPRMYHGRHSVRRSNLLRDIKVLRKEDLSPRKAYLYREAVQLREQNKKLQLRCLSYKQRVECAQNLANSRFFQNLTKDLDATTINFFLCQIRNKKLKPKGRRFTLNDKIMAMSLFKQSGKGYKLLAKMFSLPSRKTIMTLLKDIPFNTGINKRMPVVRKQKLYTLKVTSQLLKIVYPSYLMFRIWLMKQQNMFRDIFARKF